MVNGVWHSLQAASVTRYFPRSTLLAAGAGVVAASSPVEASCVPVSRGAQDATANVVRVNITVETRLRMKPPLNQKKAQLIRGGHSIRISLLMSDGNLPSGGLDSPQENAAMASVMLAFETHDRRHLTASKMRSKFCEDFRVLGQMLPIDGEACFLPLSKGIARGLAMDVFDSARFQHLAKRIFAEAFLS
jgi:hypothetical protein